MLGGLQLPVFVIDKKFRVIFSIFIFYSGWSHAPRWTVRARNNPYSSDRKPGIRKEKFHQQTARKLLQWCKAGDLRTGCEFESCQQSKSSSGKDCHWLLNQSLTSTFCETKKNLCWVGAALLLSTFTVWPIISFYRYLRFL